MKNFILFLILLISVPAFSQKKGKVDPKDLQIDSLTKVTVILTHQLDSVTKSGHALNMKLDSVSEERLKYLGVYKTISDKVLKYKFDPAKTSMLIDSVNMHRDSTLAGLAAVSASLSDTIKVLKTENAKLQSSMNTLSNAEADKEKAINDLRQLKGLLDEKILTQEEYNTKKTKLLEKL